MKVIGTSCHPRVSPCHVRIGTKSFPWNDDVSETWWILRRGQRPQTMLSSNSSTIFCQVRGLCACRYCAPSCLLFGRANADTIIALFHHVMEVLILKYMIQYPLVHVDVPSVHLDFSCANGILHVAVKMQDICMTSNISYKHDRQPFPRIYGMRHYVQFTRL